MDSGSPSKTNALVNLDVRFNLLAKCLVVFIKIIYFKW